MLSRVWKILHLAKHRFLKVTYKQTLFLMLLLEDIEVHSAPSRPSRDCHDHIFCLAHHIK